MTNVSPCKTCPYRRIGCHGSCEPYQTWAKEQHEAKRKQSEAYYAQQYIPESLKKVTYEQWLIKARRGRGKTT